METLILEVASRLESGSGSRQAWLETLKRHHFNQLPQSNDPYLSGTELEQILAGALSPDQLSSLRGVAVALDFSAESGAPLNEVLLHCAEAIRDSSDSARARRLALSAPKTSTRILAILPIVGLALGTCLGINPLHTVTDGQLGTISALSGFLFMAVGILWMNRLVNQAYVH